ncbi:MAG: CHAD domain-containing protein [Flavobacteriales bacterium]|nr:CHAD domain-containing protein [Flavobacteriales bacterium]
MAKPDRPTPKKHPWGLVREHWVGLLNDLLLAVDRCLAHLGTERVHDLRVAIRRTLPVLELATVVLPDAAPWKALHQELHGLLRLTGPLRDRQLFRIRLQALGRRERALRKAPEALLAKARDQEREQKLAVRHALEEHAELFIGLHQAAAAIGRSTPQPGADLMEVVAHSRDRMERRWSQVLPGDPHTLHRARIAVKRHRYLLEALAPVLEPDVLAETEQHRHVQRLIGRWHDELLFREWLLDQGGPGLGLLARLPRMKHLPKQMGRPAH